MQNGPPELSRRARSLIARIHRDSGDLEAVHELEQHYAEIGDHNSLANLMAGWAQTLSSGHAAADALIRGADAILIGTGDRERACMFLEHALTRCPTHESALQQLAQILTQAKDLKRLRQSLRRVAAELEGDEAHTAYHATIEYRLGRLCEETFGEPGKAVLRYRRAIELAPKMLPAITAARRLYTDAGDHAAVASLYEFEIQAMDAPDDRVALLMSLAKCQVEQLSNHDEGVRALRKALQLQPHSAPLMVALAEVLADRRTSTREHPNDARRAAELFYQAARLGPAGDASGLLDAALEQDPTHSTAARWRAELPNTTTPGHAPAPPAPAAVATSRPLPALPPRPSGAAARRSSTPPAPTRSSILPPAPAVAAAPATAPPPPAIPEDLTRVAPPQTDLRTAPEASTGESASATTNVQPEPEVAPEQSREDVDAWLATPASDTTPLDTQGLRPIDGATLSELPPPPSPNPPLRAAQMASRPAIATGRNLLDKMTRLRDRLKRRSTTPSARPAAVEQKAPVRPEPASTQEQTGVQPTTRPPASTLVDILPAAAGLTAIEVNLGPTTESNFYSGFDGTMASGGVFVSTYDPLLVDTPIDLTLTLPGGYTARAHGRVRFVRDVFDFEASTEPGVGVQFEAITRESVDLIERFTQKRPPIFFD